MTDRRKVQMRYCKPCGRYTVGCAHLEWKARRKAINAESSWGWVAFTLFVGMGVVFYLGSCA